MKKTRAISLLLSLSLICAMLVPGAAAFAENESGSDSGMVISKTATANDSGSYTITLEAYATGSKIISEVTEDIPTDVVLVLDQSGSMADCIICGNEINGRRDYHCSYDEATSIDPSKPYYIKNGDTYTEVYYCGGYHDAFLVSWECEGGKGWYTRESSLYHTKANNITPKTSNTPGGTQFYEAEACSSRLSALKTTLTNFAAAVNQKAAGTDGILGTDDDVNHRIAVVGYASRADSNDPWINTELFIGANQHNYNKDAKNYYNQALQNMNTPQGQSNIQDSIGALGADGATYTDYGMEMANGILDAYPLTNNEQRNRVIILFTDGFPGRNTDNFNTTAANTAISHANTAKGKGTTVYTVGIFSGADATSAGNVNGNNTQKANWFMQQVSSNNGTPQSPSYYLSAADAGTLNSIFQQISNQIETGGAETTLGSETVVKDIISPYFTLPAGTTASGIQIDTYACTGKNGNTYTWSGTSGGPGGATATVDGDQVSVTGFNFSENWVGTETNADGTIKYRGNKLVIKFTVKPRPGFLGGNEVITNASAGIYENGSAQTPVMTFEQQPTVNVPIQDVTVTATDKNVYLKGSVTTDQLKSDATVKVGDVSLDLTKDNYGLADWQTEYVNITVTITDKDGKTFNADDLTGLTEDKDFTVTVTVSPKTAGTTTPEKGNAATAKSGTDTKKINVFKPVLTFKDSTAYYGDTAPSDLSGNLTNTEWKHGETKSTDSGVTMIGTAPTLDLTYTPEAGKIAGGKINTKEDISVDVAVKIGTADVTGNTTFQHTNCTGKTCAVPTDKEFLLHVKTCTLNITKQGGADNESYVFTVYRNGKEYSEVTVVGNTRETIYELPVGTYTIKEDTGWSWRYDAGDNGSAKLTASAPSGSIACSNSKTENYWLNGFSDVVKNIFVTNH